MAYLGRPGATAPLTSADIPDDSITAAKIVDGAIDFQDEIGFLENKATTQNLSGTYSTERMYLNDSYTLKGDVTITGHLALGTIADSDVVITQDSTERTITGSGTLEAGEVLSSKETDLTGMTGELGSAVTFPEGKVNQTKSIFVNHVLTVVCDSNTFTDLPNFNVEITPTSTSSKILVMLNIGTFNFSSTNYGIAGAGQLRRKIASGSFSAIGIGNANTIWNASFNLPQASSYMYHSVHCIFLDSPNTTSVCTYGIGLVDHNQGTKTFYLNQTGAVPGGQQNDSYSQSYGSSLIVQEIAG